MEVLLAVVIGVLYTCGVYMIMRRSIMKLIIGIGLLAYGSDLLIFAVGRVASEQPPIIEAGSKTLTVYADPVPQALVLTAIVIGFGVSAFALVLFRETVRVSGTGDVHDLHLSDR